MTSVKKRQRIILVCDNCHHRKIKCNRQLPCDSCTNRGIKSLCKYSALERELSKQGKSPDAMFGSPDAKDQELNALKNRLKELEALIGVASLGQSQNSVISSNGLTSNLAGLLTSESSPITSATNFPTPLPLTEAAAFTDVQETSPADDEGTTDFFSSFGPDPPCIRLHETFATSFPLSFISLLKRDSGYTVFWHFNRSQSQKVKFARHLIDGIGAILDGNDQEVTKEAQRKALDYFGDSCIPKPEETKLDDEVRKKINNYARSTGMLFYYGYLPCTPNQYLRITYLLPPKFIILDYLNVWFDRLATYFPIFEKTNFISDIDKIINEGNDSDPRVSLNLEKKPDLAIIASLFFVLRLTYLFILRAQDSSSDYASLLDYPISVDAVATGRQCLQEFNLSTNISFEVLQSFIMAKIFKTFSQDEGDGVRQTDMYTMALINGACVCGLNRDPDLFSHDELTWITKNHRRKVWFFLLELELMESTVYGQPLYNMNQSDVRLEEANGEDDDPTYSTLRKMIPIRALLSQLIPVLMNIQEPISLKFFKDAIAQLEQLVDNTYGTVEDAINRQLNNSDPMGTLDCFYMLSMKMFLVKMNFCLYLIYEKKHDAITAFQYYKKAFSLVYSDLNPFISILVSHQSSLDPMFSILVGSLVVRFYLIYILFGASSVIHLNFTIKLYLGTEEKPKHLYGLLKDMQFLISNALRYSGQLSKRYYIAWRASRASTYCLTETKDVRTFDELCNGKNASWIFSSAQIHELCEILHDVVGRTEPFNAPLKPSADFIWLNVVPYDESKTTEENMLSQRLHMHQIDAIWYHYTSFSQDSIPKEYQNDGSSQITSLLNSDIGENTLISGFGGLFSADDLFLGDAYYKF